MKRSRKSLLTAASVVLSTAVIAAGCSSPAAQKTDGPIVLTQSWWGGTTRAPLQQAVIDLFVKDRPNVSVQQQQAEFSAYWDRLAVQASGKNLPDVTQTQDRYLVRFSKSLLDLQPYIEDGTIDVSGIEPAVLSSGKVDGKQVMLPSSFSYRGVEFDQDLFQKAGADVPGSDTTWSVLASSLKSLARSGALPAGTYAATNQCSVDNVFYSYLKSHGVDVFDGEEVVFAASDAADYLSYWYDLQKDGALPPPDFQTANEGATIEDSMFTKGMTALQMVPANQFPASAARKGNIKLAGLPLGPAGPGNKLVVSGQSIGEDSKNSKTAAMFINFFVNNPAAAAAYKADNGIPSSAGSREALSSQDIYAVAFYDTIKDNFASFNPLPEASARVNDSLLRVCDQVAFGKASSEDAAATLLAELSAP